MANEEDNLQKLLACLVVNRENSRKSPKREYLERNLRAKLLFCENTFKEAQFILFDLTGKLSQESFDRFAEKLKVVYSEIKSTIRSKLSAMTTLDISLTLRIVDKFSGDSLELGHCLETVDLLKTYSPTVPEGNIIGFVKTRLISSAHGAIEGATTVAEAKKLLTDKFAVKLTPSACEAEMRQARQKNMFVGEFGKTVEQLAAKLARVSAIMLR